MAQVNAGRVRFVSRGEYNNSTQYYLFDLVDYNGSSYFAKANTTGNVPTNTTYWQLVAEKGNTGGDGPVGPTGNGIASITKTASAGLIDTYTITFTDGTTSTFNITNGADGDVTQEYVDEENERLKSVFNVLPKVSGSGESVTLENTGDTMLYKVDLKGNTSQEVIQGEVGLEEEDTSIYVDDVNEDKENYITLKGNTYQDGEPTPDTPQEVEVVTGLNEVKVEGKNLFDKDNANILNAYFDTSHTTITGVGNNRTTYISCKPNTTYTISQLQAVVFTIGYTEEEPVRGSRVYGVIDLYNGSAKYDGVTRINSTITTGDNAKYLCIRFASFQSSDTLDLDTVAELVLDSIQVESGNTATTYEAYKGASYPISLGDIELCKIGTYQDRIYKSNGNWYKHSEIGKIVLDGSNIAFTYQDQNVYPNSLMIPYSSRPRGLGNTSSVICSHFSNIATNVGTTLNTLYWSASSQMWICKEGFTSLNNGNTWLQAQYNNGTPVIIYYALETPTDTQITDTTLISQLNALYNATIYSTTHINTETSNLLPYINLKYNVVTASPSPDRASEVEVVKGNNTITISNEDGTKTQTYNITLGNLELCKIGDYQDYFYKDSGKWYVHKDIGKVVLNGSETYYYNSVINSMRYTAINDNLINEAIATVISNNFVGVSYYGRISITNPRIYFENNDLQIRSSGFTNINDFKIWLSTHNTTVYYVLATPTTTQITDQLLVSQLDELQKAMSYYDKTIITQTNADKPFIIDAIGIRDLQDIFNI